MRRNPHLDLSAGAKEWRDMDDGDASAYSPSSAPAYDPYGPNSADYAARTREAVTDGPRGIVRIDYGAPA